MKTTIDINDDLLSRARKLARRSGKPLRAIVEEALRLSLAQAQSMREYRLPDRSICKPDAPDQLERLSWQDLRAEIYGEPDRRG